MHKSNKQLTFAALIVVLSLVATSVTVLAGPSTANLFAESPNLGAAASFSILGETEITNIQYSVISADVGLSPAAGSNIAGLTSAEVGGRIYTTTAGGPAGSVVNPTLLTTAINNMYSAYVTLSNLTCEYDFTGLDKELTDIVNPLPGVYCARSFLVTGNLILQPGVYVFQSSEGLTTAEGSTVTSDDPCNVWWQVGTNADLGVDSTFVGNILSGTHINLQTRAEVVGGRLLAQSAVTLDQNTITGCAVPYPYVAPTPTTEPSAPTPQPETLPDTGGDLAGPGSQIIQISLGGLGLSLVLFGFLVSRRTQKTEG